MMQESLTSSCLSFRYDKVIIIRAYDSTLYVGMAPYITLVKKANILLLWENKYISVI